MDNFNEENNKENQGTYSSEGASGTQGSYTDQNAYGDQTAYGSQDAYGNQNDYGSQSTYGSQDTYGSQNAYDYQNAYGAQNTYGSQNSQEYEKLPKNRFALKIVAAVLEILSVCLCNPITMVLGIVGLIFACGANSCYQQGRWEEFKSKAKTSAILLWIGLAVDVLIVVLWVVLIVGVCHGLQESGEWAKVMQIYDAYQSGELDEALDTYSDEELVSILEGYLSGDYDDVLDEYYGDTEYDISDVLEDFEFGDTDTTDDSYTYDDDYYYEDDTTYDYYYEDDTTYDYIYEDIEYDYKEFGSLGDYWKLNIEGKAYEIPLALSGFIDAGYVTDVEEPESEIVEAGDLYVLALSNADGYEFMYVEAYNAGDSAAALTDCIVIAVEVCNPDVYFGDGFEYEFSMDCGITFDSTYDEIVEAFGEPSYAEEDEDYTYYEWDYEEEYYDFIIITVSADGVIEDITVSYVADYNMDE